MQIRCSNCFQEYEADYGVCPYCGYSEGDATAEAYCLTPGTEIAGRYTIGRMLGLGGFGITYQAWDQKLETVMAVKEYYPSGLVNRLPGQAEVMLVASKREEEFRYGKERFLEEARNLARFNTHPNIVNVYDFFEANNTAYIVMEFLDGQTLSKFLQQSGAPLPWERCLELAQDVCAALSALHAQNILHRDVSPDNIFLCRNGAVKLIDFGAARFASDQGSPLTIVVKPGFAPPEQYERVNRQGPWTDIYALGGTLYYALTGQKPPESTDRKIQDELVSPSALRADIPEHVSVAILRAMALDPRFRYQRVEEFQAVLTAQKKAVPLEAARRRRKRRRTLGICASLLVLAAAFGTFALLWHSRQLPQADLTLWYRSTGEEALDTAKEEALQAIIERFTQEYTGVTVSVEGIPAAEYARRLGESVDGAGPDLYESTGLDGAALPNAAGLDGPLEALAQTDPAAAAPLEGERQYPTGLALPLLYVNTSLGSVGSSDDVSALAGACEAAGSTLALSPACGALFTALYGPEVEDYAAPSALEDFLSGEVLLYLGSSADYPAIQEAMPGLYQVQFPACGQAAYTCATLWSVTDSGGDEERAATALLEFFSSDAAQDYFHIRHRSGAIPISPAVREEYAAVYPEFSALSEYLALPYAAGPTS